MRHYLASRRLASILFILLLGVCGASAGRTPTGPTIVVTSSQAGNQSFVIKFDVLASTMPIVLQGCPDAEAKEWLCNVWVQVLSNGVWKAVQHRCKGCKRGSVPTTEGKALSVPPHGSAHFTLIVRKEYRMEKGQRLRVFVDAWPDEPSMRRYEKTITLTSQVFTCP